MAMKIKNMPEQDVKGYLELGDFLDGFVYISGWGAIRQENKWLPPQEFIICYKNKITGSIHPNLFRKDICALPDFMAANYGFSVKFPDYFRKSACGIEQDIKIFASYEQAFSCLKQVSKIASLNGRLPEPQKFIALNAESSQQYGLIDHCLLTCDKLSVGGWAFFNYSSTTGNPVSFIIRIGNSLHIIAPNAPRDDVRKIYNLPLGCFGFKVELSIKDEVSVKNLTDNFSAYAVAYDDEIFQLPLRVKPQIREKNI